jgi:hypothetical protein
MGKLNKFILALNNNGIKDFQNYQLVSAEKDGRLKIKHVKTNEESIIHVEGKLEREILKLESTILKSVITPNEISIISTITSLESVIEENKLESNVSIHESIISMEESVISIEEKIIEEKSTKKKNSKKTEIIEEVKVEKIEEPVIKPEIDPVILAEEMERIKSENEVDLSKKIDVFKSDLLIPNSGKIDIDPEETEMELI